MTSLTFAFLRIEILDMETVALLDLFVEPNISDCYDQIVLL